MSSIEKMPSTPISRSGQNTIEIGVGLVFGLFMAYWAWDANHGVIAAVIVLFCVIGGYMLRTGTGVGKAACPACSKELDELGLSKYKRCFWCFAYSEVRDVRLWQVEEGRVEAIPEFVIPLTETVQMPGLCCACGQQATRSKGIVANFRVRHSQLPIVNQSEYTLDLPYCDSHDDGAETATDVMGVEGKPLQKEVPALKVSSYRFYREFLRLNGVVGNPSIRVAW